MAEFTGKAIVSPEQLSVEDQAKANPPAQVDHHSALFVAGGAEVELRQCDEAGVIFNIGLDADLICYIMSDTFSPGLQERVVDALFSIDKPRHADADACDLSFFNSCF